MDPEPPPGAPPIRAPLLRRGGLVFRVGLRRSFLAAELALRVTPRPPIARIPGAPPGLLGVALSDGVILPVIELGSPPPAPPVSGPMIVCLHRGEQLGLVGASDIVSGMFAASDAAGVLVLGEAVRELDVEEIYARVHVVSWGAGWG